MVGGTYVLWIGMRVFVVQIVMAHGKTYIVATTIIIIGHAHAPMLRLSYI